VTVWTQTVAVLRQTQRQRDWRVATHCGRIRYMRRKVNLSQVFARQDVGVTQVDDHIWLVTFMAYISAISTTRPVASSRSRTRSARNCYPCLRNELLPMSPEWTL
jgi:hypothetical protein